MYRASAPRVQVTSRNLGADVISIVINIVIVIVIIIVVMIIRIVIVILISHVYEEYIRLAETRLAQQIVYYYY